MAYQTRGRDPLLDSNMQAAIERRGKELVGVVLLGIGILATIAFGSYSPDDPSWMSFTDAPVQNWLGRIGAGLSAPSFMILGMGSWGIAVMLLGWGLRLALHQGTERAMSRVVFAPIWIALLSLYAASLIPGQSWSHSFGLGGLFGDTVLGTLVGVAPVSASAGLKILSLILGLGVASMAFFVLGFTRRELQRILQLAIYGVVVAYMMLTKLGGKAALATWSASRRAHQAQSEFRARRRAEAEERAAERAALQAAAAAVPAPQAVQYAPDDAYDSAPMADDATDDALQDRPSFRDRLTGIVRRAAPVTETAPAAAPVAAYDTDPAFAYDTSYDQGHDAGFDHHAPQQAGFAAAPAAPTVAHHEPPMQRAPEPDTPPLPRLGGVTRPAPAAAPLSYDDHAYADDGALGHATPSAPAPEAAPAPIQKQGFLSGLTGIIRRSDKSTAAPFADLSEDDGGFDDLPTDDRIKAKIADVVRQRARSTTRVVAPAHLPVTKGRGRGPDPLILNAADQGMRSEPPVTSASGPAPTQMDADTAAQPDLGTIPAAPAQAAFQETLVEDAALPLPEATPEIAAAPVLPQAVVEQPRRVVQPAARKTPAPSTRAKAEAQPALNFEDKQVDWELPPLGLLSDPSIIERHHLSDDALEENARMLESVLDDYGVKGEIVSVRPGPVVTMYELEPAAGLKASRVIGLADDIARSMSALSARVSTVPGRSVIGIELPNDKREMVVLREILAAREFGDSHMKLPLALGKDIGGDSVVANLAKMPHLLIAGTTGSGKSVAINTMILSLLYKLTPEDCRLIMIDPKMLELSVYDGIPHLLSPVVTDPKKAVVALKWVVGEMEDRYRKMSKMGVRNIDGFNSRVADALSKGEMFTRTVQTGFEDETGEPVFETEETRPEKMPYIVVIVDEMADLMMVAGKEIEACIQRLAQMARASGIHLIMATQRPSVDVITGTIKANFPTRISFQVTSKIDSRTILGEMGAEQLLGQGDMLYMAGGAKIQRCHGPFVSDEEVEEIVTFLKGFGPPDYITGVVEGPDEDTESDIDLVLGLGGNTNGEDALYDQAVAVVIKDRKCSTSYIQRKLGIGYNKAARLVEQMEDQGLVSSANHVGKREILVPEQ
ncbi:MAG: DNA translocase FtsK 4TM domain-containing protein [Pseudooceanicola sp.]